jgi:hypothetical protein
MDKNWLTHNWHLKVIALILAGVTWWYVKDKILQQPISFKKMLIPSHQSPDP